MQQNKSKNTIIRDSIALFLITLIAGLALGFVYEITKPIIQAAKDKEKQEAYQSVFTDATSFTDSDKKYTEVEDTSKETLTQAKITNVTVNEVLEAKVNDELVGYVMTVTSSEGYGGDIKISLGVKLDGTVMGIEILESSETSGLGSKASEPQFKDQFKDKNVEEFEYSKTTPSKDNEIQAISGATITTSAVTKAVNGGLYFAKNCTVR